jgi:K+-sensing histidine kinase KdpD
VPVETRGSVAGIGLALAAVAPVLVVAALVPLRRHVENTNLALGLVVVVLLAAVAGGRAGGVVAALTAAVAFDFFLTRPYYSFRITTSDDLQTTALLAVIGVISGEVVERARRHGARAAHARAELDAVYQRAELAAGTEEPGRLTALAAQELTRLLDLKSCRYVPGPMQQALPELRHDSIRVPANVDPSARGLVALPVRAHGRLQGHLVLVFPTDTVGTSLTSDQRHAAVALADQVGIGLLRFHDR